MTARHRLDNDKLREEEKQDERERKVRPLDQAPDMPEDERGDEG